MPGPALANLMWGGREHPDYQNLSDAMRMLLSDEERGAPCHICGLARHGLFLSGAVHHRVGALRGDAVKHDTHHTRPHTGPRL